jgi:hypothetical protein
MPAGDPLADQRCSYFTKHRHCLRLGLRAEAAAAGEVPSCGAACLGKFPNYPWRIVPRINLVARNFGGFLPVLTIGTALE